MLRRIVDPNGVGIKLDATQVVAVGAFLRVINTLEKKGKQRNKGVKSVLVFYEFSTIRKGDIRNGGRLYLTVPAYSPFSSAWVR